MFTRQGEGDAVTFIVGHQEIFVYRSLYVWQREAEKYQRDERRLSTFVMIMVVEFVCLFIVYIYIFSLFVYPGFFCGVFTGYSFSDCGNFQDIFVYCSFYIQQHEAEKYQHDKCRVCRLSTFVKYQLWSLYRLFNLRVLNYNLAPQLTVQYNQYI